MSDISQRKADHIEVAASGQADFSRTTLLEEVHLLHHALPERALDEIDLSTELAGMRLSAPIVVTGMTGGTDEARAINRDIARAAQELGIAFGVGSQRAMAEHPGLEDTFQVRDVAPEVALIGNIGAVQARHYGVEGVRELCQRIGANAMAVHLNPAQELIQERGDRDFRGALDAIRELVAGLHVPVIVKETGCGIAPGVAAALAGVGVGCVDVSGAGGTSWIAVEARRADDASAARRLGDELWDWGLPTAVSVAATARQQGVQVIASGGIRSGLDIARAMALGASAGGMAAPVLRAQRAGGYRAVHAFLTELVASVRAITLLTGCARASELSRAPRHLGAALSSWLHDLGVR